MNLTQSEYMERLVNLLPDSTFVGKTKLVFDKDCLLHASEMVEDLSEAMWVSLSGLQDVDYVADLKDATRNLVVLGRFLSVSYGVITG